jgi:SAM-dependent methyltransferase
VQRPARSSFFLNRADEESLAEANQLFWDALLRHITADLQGRQICSVLDVGCHQGGLLLLLSRQIKCSQLWGIEPIAPARAIASHRLLDAGLEPVLLDVDQWCAIPSAGVDLIVCHEVLYLVSDLKRLMDDFRRVLRPGAAAYVVLGCHGENPVWEDWSRSLAEEGHATYTYKPLEIMAAASDAKLSPSVRPLRRDGWINYDPTVAQFKFSNLATMLDHHYRHKLLFRLQRVC